MKTDGVCATSCIVTAVSKTSRAGVAGRETVSLTECLPRMHVWSRHKLAIALPSTRKFDDGRWTRKQETISRRGTLPDGQKHAEVGLRLGATPLTVPRFRSYLFAQSTRTIHYVCPRPRRYASVYGSRIRTQPGAGVYKPCQCDKSQCKLSMDRCHESPYTCSVPSQP